MRLSQTESKISKPYDFQVNWEIPSVYADPKLLETKLPNSVSTIVIGRLLRVMKHVLTSQKTSLVELLEDLLAHQMGSKAKMIRIQTKSNF